jgi:hypothetical protein
MPPCRPAFFLRRDEHAGVEAGRGSTGCGIADGKNSRRRSCRALETPRAPPQPVFREGAQRTLLGAGRQRAPPTAAAPC